jgi:hypothetical protein
MPENFGAIYFQPILVRIFGAVYFQPILAKNFGAVLEFK